ncbi:MAG: hypothetical protein V2A73_08765 [Pseudomonadota bacterium]
MRLAYYRLRYWFWSAAFHALCWVLTYRWTDDILTDGWRARLALGAASRSWNTPEEDMQWWLESRAPNARG